MTAPSSPPPVPPITLTPTRANVVRVFLVDPDEPQFLPDLMKRTGGSGDIAPFLAHLVGQGWLRSYLTAPTESAPNGQRAYLITEAGAAMAARCLAEPPRIYPGRVWRAIIGALDWIINRVRKP